MFDITTPNWLTTALRDAAKGLGGILIGTGLVSEADFVLWSGIAIFVASSGYAVWKQIKMREAQG